VTGEFMLKMPVLGMLGTTGKMLRFGNLVLAILIFVRAIKSKVWEQFETAMEHLQ